MGGALLASPGRLAGTPAERAMVRALQDFLSAIRSAEALALDPVAHAQAGPRRTAVVPNPTPLRKAEGEAAEPRQPDLVEAVLRIMVPATERFGRDVAAILPGSETRLAQQASYAAAAFADERLLRFSWPGRPQWLDQPLELRLFDSRSAGERVFRHADQLSPTSTADRALATLYLTMLNLGFSGRYDPVRDADALVGYRQRLFELLTGRAPMPERAADRMVDPGSPPQQGEAPRYLPYLRPWVTAAALIVLGWAGLQHVVWELRTALLEAEVTAIIRDLDL